MTYDYAKQWNPLFAARPEWLRISTCFSAYGLGAGYVIMFLTFAFKLESLRGLCLFIMGAKSYAIATYYYVVFFGDIALPDLGMFLAADGPYLLGIFLVLSRLLFNSRPFSQAKTPVTAKKSAPAKKLQ